MTEGRLAHIEWQFRNPASAAAMADLGLELVAALRALRSPVMVVATHNLAPEPIMEVVADQHFGGAVDKHAAPTPPLREKRKAK